MDHCISIYSQYLYIAVSATAGSLHLLDCTCPLTTNTLYCLISCAADVRLNDETHITFSLLVSPNKAVLLHLSTVTASICAVLLTVA